jgi:CDP-ribitol ribitolphosphotransferase / teichoic acid ribitol-phosphate polymerase
MRVILFCANPYAFGILKPLYDELLAQHHEIIWYAPQHLAGTFPFQHCELTANINKLIEFQSDAIFVPGNEVPHYLRGVKVQVFHGLAGEKKGHFRIRNYFDLYLTQGPYFTNRFNELAKQHNDFEVTETGWCKLDPLYRNHEEYLAEKKSLLQQHNKKHLVLYAPTFSPSLTSATTSVDALFELANKNDILLLIKFHDLMNKEVVKAYELGASERDNVKIINDPNILKPMIMADFMISDTSSVVYEFTLLDKPVITINSTSQQVTWCNILSPSELARAFEKELAEDNYSSKRALTIQQYHPYTDGQSSARMIAAVENYIKRNGVPEKRKLNLYRRYLMNKMFRS